MKTSILYLIVVLFVSHASGLAQGDSTRRGKLGFYVENNFRYPDFSNLNQALTQQGFPAIQNIPLGVSFGYTVRPIFSKDSYSAIKFSFSGNSIPRNLGKDANIRFLEISFGNYLDLVASRKWLVYPYWGLGVNFATLSLVDNTNSQPSFSTSIANLQTVSSKSFFASSVFLNAGAGFERRLRISFYDFYVGLSGGYRLSTDGRFREPYQSYQDSPSVQLSSFEWNFRVRFEIWNMARLRKLDEKRFRRFK